MQNSYKRHCEERTADNNWGWTSWRSTRPRARSRIWVAATPAINTGWGMKGLRAALPRRTRGYSWMKSWMWGTNVRLQPRRPTTSWAASKAAWPAGRGRGFCPATLLWWDLTWSPASSSGALSTEKTWTCWSGSGGGPQILLEGKSILLWGQAETVGVVQPGEQTAAGRPYCGFSVHKGGL